MKPPQLRFRQLFTDFSRSQLTLRCAVYLRLLMEGEALRAPLLASAAAPVGSHGRALRRSYRVHKSTRGRLPRYRAAHVT